MADRARKRRQHGAGCRQQGGNDGDRDALGRLAIDYRGEIRGDAALADVSRDRRFSLMIHWDDFFGAANVAAGKEKSGKNSDGRTAERKTAADDFHVGSVDYVLGGSACRRKCRSDRDAGDLRMPAACCVEPEAGGL